MSPNLPPSCREKRNDYTQINPGMKAITQAISNRSLGHPQPLNSLSEEMLTKRATRSDRGSYYKSITSIWARTQDPKKQYYALPIKPTKGQRWTEEDLLRTAPVDHQTAISAQFYTGSWCLLSVQRPGLLLARLLQRYVPLETGSRHRLPDSARALARLGWSSSVTKVSDWNQHSLCYN